MKTLFVKEVEQKYVLKLVPSGDVKDFNEGIEVFPLGKNVYELDVEALLNEIAMTVGNTAASIGTLEKFKQEDLNRAVYTAVIRALNK